VLAAQPAKPHLHGFRQPLQNGAAAYLQTTNAAELVGEGLLHDRQTMSMARCACADAGSIESTSDDAVTRGGT
jgi:hypothetical protein